MGKFLLRFLILLLVIISCFIIYTSYFGIETNKFDTIIKEKANEVYRYVKLDFKNTKIHLNPKELNLTVKLQNPKILVKDLRNNLEITDPDSVLDGDIDEFLEAALYQTREKK